MSKLKEEAEKALKSRIKKVFINTMAKYMLIPVTVLLAIFIAVIIWSASTSAGRRF